MPDDDVAGLARELGNPYPNPADPRFRSHEAFDSVGVIWVRIQRLQPRVAVHERPAGELHLFLRDARSLGDERANDSRGALQGDGPSVTGSDV